MPNIEDALYARLIAVSAVTSLVSTRIYPIKKDTGASAVWPFVTYSTVLSNRSRAMVADNGYVESSIRFHIWTKGASAFSSGGSISAAIRGALERWSGTSAAVVVDHVFLDGEFDIEDAEPGVFHRVLDFDARWYE